MSKEHETSNTEIDPIFAGGTDAATAPVLAIPAVQKAVGISTLLADAEAAEQAALAAEQRKYELEAMEDADPATVKRATADWKAKKAAAKSLRKQADAERKQERAGRPGLRLVQEGETPENHKPIISLDDEPQAVQDIYDLLHSSQGPDVYLRGIDLVTSTQKDGTKTLVPLTPARLANILSRCAEVTRTARDGVRRVLVPPSMGSVVLASPEWNLPVIQGITPVPLMRADGSFNTTPGYDKETRYFYEPRYEVEVSEEPSAEEIAEARALLVDQVLADFPWMERSDKAAFLGMLFIPILRGLTTAPSMMFLVNAHDPGTGKTLLVSILDRLYGHDELAWANSDTEMSKKITATLCSASSPIVRCDNVPNGHEIGYASIDRVVTGKEWGDRLLGQSQQIQVPNGRLWVFNGNNIRVGKDTGRRTVWCRLAAKGRPTDRKPSDFILGDLEPWLDENTDKVLHALLTLSRGWAQAGSPKTDDYISSFGPWAGMLGGLLKWMGIEGWLEGRDEMVLDQDEPSREWEAFLHAWYRRHGNTVLRVSDLKSSSYGEDEDSRLLMEAFIREEATGEVPNDKKLGRWLGAREGRKFGKECYEIQRVKDSRTKTYKYRVVRDEEKAAEVMREEARRAQQEREAEALRTGVQKEIPIQVQAPLSEDDPWQMDEETKQAIGLIDL